MFMLGCLTVASLSTVVLCSRLGGGVCWGRLFTPYLPPPTTPKPKPQAAPWLMPPLTLLTSEANPRPAGHSLKPPTVTTQPPPVAATLLPLTYHPKHYHKLLPGCQAAHTAELTVRLWTTHPCKDSSVWGQKVELVEKYALWVTMAFYTWHKTYCGVLCFVACGDAVAFACGTYSCPLQQLLCSIWGWWKMCPAVCEPLRNMPQVFLLAWQIAPFHIASATAEIEESIEVWLSWEDHTHLVLR